MKIDIFNSRRYSDAQIHVQKTDFVFLGLIVTGLNYMRIFSPDGRIAGTAENSSLILIPEKFTLEFAFNAERENYVTLCRMPELIWNQTQRCQELHIDNQVFRIPFVVPVTHDQLLNFRGIFRRTELLRKSSLPRDMLTSELLMAAVAAEFIACPGEMTRQPPAALLRFKSAIDADVAFSKTLTELAAEAGFSMTHLRRLFIRQYRLEPSDYRAKLRFNRIIELMVQRRASFKEIADMVGMRNVTHLHLFIRKHCRMTPGQLFRNLNV